MVGCWLYMGGLHYVIPLWGCYYTEAVPGTPDMLRLSFSCPYGVCPLANDDMREAVGTWDGRSNGNPTHTCNHGAYRICNGYCLAQRVMRQATGDRHGYCGQEVKLC